MLLKLILLGWICMMVNIGGFVLELKQHRWGQFAVDVLVTVLVGFGLGGLAGTTVFLTINLTGASMSVGLLIYDKIKRAKNNGVSTENITKRVVKGAVIVASIAFCIGICFAVLMDFIRVLGG